MTKGTASFMREEKKDIKKNMLTRSGVYYDMKLKVCLLDASPMYIPFDASLDYDELWSGIQRRCGACSDTHLLVFKGKVVTKDAYEESIRGVWASPAYSNRGVHVLRKHVKEETAAAE